MNEIITTEEIKCMIYEIRGKKVILDSDLAKLYGYSQGTKALNQAVKRNIERFPEDFYFQLTKEEFVNLKSQIVTSSLNEYGGIRKMPYVFTEEGIAMLSSILKTKTAVLININIMRAFVTMKHLIIENNDIYQSLNNINNKLDKHEYKLIEHENKFKDLFSKFDKEELEEKIFFEGSIYDAYSKLIDIMNTAKNELIIIDNYADKSVLDMISKIKVNTILIAKEKGLLRNIDIKKYNEQYHNLKIIYNNGFHDRYLIIDRSIIYHCGTSINKAGNKTFSLNRLKDKKITTSLIDEINKIIIGSKEII